MRRILGVLAGCVVLSASTTIAEVPTDAGVIEPEAIRNPVTPEECAALWAEFIAEILEGNMGATIPDCLP